MYLKPKKLLYCAIIFIVLSVGYIIVSCDNTDGADDFDETATEIPEEVEQYDKLIESGVVYKTAMDTYDMADLKLDIYYPTNRIYKKNPAIVAFHGGSWIVGDRSDIIFALNPLYERLRANGYAIITVQYRFVSDEIYFPSNLEDCIDAILYLAENTDKYDIDPNAIGVMGFSAGAHLAMMCAYAMEEFSAGGDFIDLNYCLSFAGPTKLYDDEANSYPRSILYVLDALFNGSYEEKPELYKSGSPYYHMDGKVKTPLLIVQGDRDDVVPYRQSTLMIERAKESGIECEFLTLENVGHMINFYNSMDSAATDKAMSSIEQFVYKYTRK